MTAPPEIRALTGLRGAAACVVVLYHYTSGGLGFGPFAGLVHRGYQAVDLFFVLSGYVLVMTYADRLQGRLTVAAYRDFIVRRVGRVYPLFIAVTLVSLCLWRPVGGWSMVTIVSNALLIQAWGAADSIGGPTWSISTEFAAYLLFPVVCSLVVWSRPVWAGGTVLLAMGTVVFVSGRDTSTLHQLALDRSGPLDVYQGTTVYPLFRCLAGFVLGALSYRIGRARIFSGIWACKGFADACAVGIIALLWVPGTDVVLPLLFVVLIPGLSYGRSLAASALGCRGVHWLGVVSYSIYLIHRPFEHVFRASVREQLRFWHVPHDFSISALLLLAPLALVSGLAYACVEVPGRRLPLFKKQIYL